MEAYWYSIVSNIDQENPNDIIATTECIVDLALTFAKEASWLFLGHFWPLIENWLQPKIVLSDQVKLVYYIPDTHGIIQH